MVRQKNVLPCKKKKKKKKKKKVVAFFDKDGEGNQDKADENSTSVNDVVIRNRSLIVLQIVN
jgi:hypothetical protein